MWRLLAFPQSFSKYDPGTKPRCPFRSTVHQPSSPSRMTARMSPAEMSSSSEFWARNGKCVRWEEPPGRGAVLCGPHFGSACLSPRASSLLSHAKASRVVPLQIDRLWGSPKALGLLTSSGCHGDLPSWASLTAPTTAAPQKCLSHRKGKL